MEKTNLKLKKLKITMSGISKLILLTLPFLLIDCFIRLMAIPINYHMLVSILPSILFTVIWIGLIVFLSVCFKQWIGRIFYLVCFVIFFVLFVCHSFYFPYTDRIFSLRILQSAKGSGLVISEMLKHSGILVYLKCAVVLIAGILAVIKFPKIEKNHFLPIPAIFIVFIVLHIITPLGLGIANRNLKWDTWQNAKNVYNNFLDSNKSIKVCGFYEYSVRDFYVSFLKGEQKENPEELAFLKTAYSKSTKHKENDYTGIFKGKNVIFLQLEGIDSWLLTKQDMPNLYGMLDNSLVFDDHYSFYSSGGSTFNSEFAVATGFFTPVSYVENAYSFVENSFPYSLPNQLKKHGYSANGFHMNSGEYYMRTLNYKNWGYDNYYSLVDDTNYNDLSYQLDRELILNEFFYEKMFKQEQPFMNYIISFTPHTPFSLNSKTGKLLYREVYGEDAEIPKMNEEETARFFATETDRMIGLLIEALKDNNLFENTVIVAFTDHYLYTLKDQSILDKYKVTENNLVNKTPFIIWSHDLDAKTISKVNSQLDILPTILNMLDIEYYDEYYIGRDIMDESYSGYVFFSDYSWYDGKNYVENGKSNIPTADVDYVNETNTIINNLIKRNDLTLKYNYFEEK